MISQINNKIKILESDKNYIRALSLKKQYIEEHESEISSYKDLMFKSKKNREERRKQILSNEEKEIILKESQYQQSELKRIQSRCKNTIDNVEIIISEYKIQIDSLKHERKQRSAELQKKIFESFIILNYKKEKKDLLEIFSKTALKTPPSGSGECCAPKLLQYAYLKSLEPISMAEFWIGKSPTNTIRKDGVFYPACTGKCGPILDFMLQGLDVMPNPLIKSSGVLCLDVLYEDNFLVIINKPSGILSVPGKISKDSCLSILRKQLEGRYTDLFAVHRLDMATSGVLMFAKDINSYKLLQNLFLEHHVEKEYTAILSKEISQDKGIIDLPLIPDYIERPKQKVDFENGKKAITKFYILEKGNGISRVRFIPVTGRTHQLRVHSAHEKGLNSPIVGDELYGKKDDRLYLHSSKISFIHPILKERIDIRCNPDF